MPTTWRTMISGRCFGQRKVSRFGNTGAVAVAVTHLFRYGLGGSSIGLNGTSTTRPS